MQKIFNPAQLLWRSYSVLLLKGCLRLLSGRQGAPEGGVSNKAADKEELQVNMSAHCCHGAARVNLKRV